MTHNAGNNNINNNNKSKGIENNINKNNEEGTNKNNGRRNKYINPRCDHSRDYSSQNNNETNKNNNNNNKDYNLKIASFMREVLTKKKKIAMKS